jgi:hypothetical protein
MKEQIVQIPTHLIKQSLATIADMDMGGFMDVPLTSLECLIRLLTTGNATPESMALAAELKDRTGIYYMEGPTP